MKVEEPKENYEDGWVKIFRSVMKKGWFLKGDYFKLWCYILMKATHREYENWFDGKSITLKPGQFITGRKKMSMETGIHESSLERMLTYFEKIEQQIEQRKTSVSRLISVINWASYQTSEQHSEQPLNNGRTTIEQPLNTIQELKELKELKNLLLQDEIWKEVSCISLRIKAEEIDAVIETFTNHVLLIGDRHKNLKSFKAHFYYWYPLYISKKPIPKFSAFSKIPEMK